jgi:hypothetical protein
MLPLAGERLTYHALFADLQALLVEDYTGALTIAATPSFIALLQQGNHPGEPALQRLRWHTIQLLNQVRGELTPQAGRPPAPGRGDTPRAATPLPPRVAALVTHTDLR